MLFFRAGTNGWIVIGDGEVCPPSLPAPMSTWEDISNNYVLTITYRDPDFRVVDPVIMPGASIPAFLRGICVYEERMWKRGSDYRAVAYILASTASTLLRLIGCAHSITFLGELGFV